MAFTSYLMCHLVIFFFGMVRGKLEMRLNEKTLQNEKIKNLKIEIYF